MKAMGGYETREEKGLEENRGARPGLYGKFGH